MAKFVRKNKDATGEAAVKITHIPLLSKYFLDAEEGKVRQVKFLWTDKIEDKDVFFYRINYRNPLKNNAIVNSYFVGVWHNEQVVNAFVGRKNKMVELKIPKNNVDKMQLYGILNPKKETKV